MNSPTHRQNILDAGFTEIGIATAKGIYKDRETTFVVQFFGRPTTVTSTKAAADLVANEIGLTSAESPSEVDVAGESIVNYDPVADEAATIKINNYLVAEDNSLETIVLPVAYSSQLNQLASSPSQLITYVYAILGALIFLFLLLMIFIEVRRQHPRHIAYGVFLLVLVIAAVYFNRLIVLNGLLIS